MVVMVVVVVVLPNEGVRCSARLPPSAYHAAVLPLPLADVTEEVGGGCGEGGGVM